MNYRSKNVSKIFASGILSIVHMFIPIIILTTVTAGCGSNGAPPSKALAETRTMFQEVIEEFDAQKEKVHEELEEGQSTLLTFKEAIKTAQNKDTEFSRVYTKWKRIEVEVKQLHGKFENLVKGADALYAELEAKANSITDDKLKTKSLQSLTESKENYIIRLKQTRNKINLLDVVNTKVRDTMTALEISYTLDVLEERLSQTFQEIDTMVASVMKELEELSRESKALLTKRLG